ncbi:hypothetical protein ACQPZP_02875 [Spirillospora sp. CA-142024]|uniref:hypothetical protein n=1 Tax=Spirillospora sp. CA-142024 TaxID=3240036 RepID=UPI003D8FA98E
MPDPSSTMVRLLPARRHHPRRETRRFVTRAELDLIALASVSAGQDARSKWKWSSAWTLYSRWEWAMATARAERARRRARPPWG